MSQYLDKDRNLILQFSLPKEKLDILLKELNYPDVLKIGDAPFEQKRILILVSFREFLKGNLFLEEFSEIASNIKMLFPMETRTPEQEDYEFMICEAADMSLYVRLHDRPPENMFAGFMDTVWNYFNKYKHLLNNLPGKYSLPSPIEKD
jgi:uncharacterized protein YeeX (DUF496 family)